MRFQPCKKQTTRNEGRLPSSWAGLERTREPQGVRYLYDVGGTKANSPSLPRDSHTLAAGERKSGRGEKADHLPSPRRRPPPSTAMSTLAAGAAARNLADVWSIRHRAVRGAPRTGWGLTIRKLCSFLANRGLRHPANELSAGLRPGYGPQSFWGGELQAVGAKTMQERTSPMAVALGPIKGGAFRRSQAAVRPSTGAELRRAYGDARGPDLHRPILLWPAASGLWWACSKPVSRFMKDDPAPTGKPMLEMLPRDGPGDPGERTRSCWRPAASPGDATPDKIQGAACSSRKAPKDPARQTRDRSRTQMVGGRLAQAAASKSRVHGSRDNEGPTAFPQRGEPLRVSMRGDGALSSTSHLKVKVVKW